MLGLQQLRSLTNFSSFDTSTEEGRSNERHRRIFLTAAASALAKVVSMATMLFSIPLTLHYLGPERFGLWMTISSLIAMLGFADLGIGNGLLNAVSEAKGKDDEAAIRSFISSGFVILSGIALVVLLAFSLIYSVVAWAQFFNVKSAIAMRESATAVAVFVICFALNIPAGIVQRTQMGLQMGFLANLWQAAGSLLALIAVLLTIHLRMGLPWLVGAMAGVPVIAAYLNGLFFWSGNARIRPNWTSVSRRAMQKIAYAGSLFLVQQLAVSLAYTSDNIVISRVLGAEAVTRYAVPVRLFSLVPLLLGMVLMPLWPAYGEALSRGDGKWVKSIFARSLKISIAFSFLLAATLVWFANDILSIWIGPHLSPPFLLLLGLGIWKILEGWGIPVAAFLNGANAVRVQALSASLMALCAIALKIILIRAMGISGVIWATIFSYSALTFVPLSVVTYRLLKRIQAETDLAIGRQRALALTV